MICFQITVHLETPGLNLVIREAAGIIGHALDGIAEAIDGLAPPPPVVVQITAGSARFDPQILSPIGDPMPNIINNLPQHVTVGWTGQDANGNTVAVIPDSASYSSTDLSGTITPDPTNPTGGFTYMATPGLTGDVTFTLTSHQNGLADFTQPPLVGTLVNPPPAEIQVTGGTASFDPQTPGGRKR